MDNNRATSSMWHRLVNIQNYRREQLAYSWLPKRSRNKFLLFSTSKVQVRVTGPHLKFMGALRTAAHSLFGDTCKAEYKVSKDAGFAVDFYFPNEKIAVEIAAQLRGQPISEYERDIFKCLLAQQSGCSVQKLLFITKPGGLQKNNAPGPRAIQAFDLKLKLFFD